MVREFFISIYLLIFRITFHLLNFIPSKEKTTLVASFGDNISHVAEELEATTNTEIVILKATGCKKDFKHISSAKIIDFQSKNPINFVSSIFHLATSKVIFIDNYFGFLSVMNFKPEVICVQLWHAAGAIKRFGLTDPSIEQRSQKAIKRFKAVYERFHYVVVGSEKMAAIFRKSFDLKPENILRTGIPRTDFFFDKQKTSEVRKELAREFPVINEKKVLLYAPTFRDDQLQSPDLALDLDRLHKELSDEYVLFLRLHPAVSSQLNDKYPDFVIDVKNYENINHLLLVTDILISDYSSIPFEYSLLEKPMIFYSYDLENYQTSRGFWEDYHKSMPGPVVNNTEEVLSVIRNNSFSLKQIKQFANEWNQYSKGNSSQSLISFVYEQPESAKVLNQ
ncbi:CDP-glycerol glycerophosphotransferase family protein [Virgibacillus senegalensis]|uniref:CDP-glycerol glycerophosphotransferase family protein n=1 Tax=Virgibacillus senegalensis TaxID=1499679 RepID=UPI00069D73BE|nr:CDP-glycerol glycerophosphotransferase family protein [Virgibacillus senegalensis]